ncbi:MAG: type VI secretion protein IcmF/TssM N-terminal domain-containing protein, partial [Desulfovibrionaceae bacterium]|nr:type VI secretion protein IcmF/TssM N-terminal domain-containing protein [Desulfovibrionaceae bacterium]
MSRLLGFLLRFLLLLLLCNLLGIGAWFLHSRQGWSWWEVGSLGLGTTALILLAFILRRLYFRHKEERFIRKMVEHDHPRMEQADEAANMAGLRERWLRGLEMLRQSRGLQGNPVYSLPWFMVFGESGSGKSTAISHARLSASASDAGPLAHVTNTRNCDWWFFDRAVVLDTAGRYAVPIHEEADRREWEEFLRLLAAHRRREPLNGLIVTLSAEHLQERSEEQLADYGRCLRQRMNSMVRALGAHFPVYLLITKMDRVLGFTALTGLMSREECHQALGLLDREDDAPTTGRENAEEFLNRALAHVGRRLQDMTLLFLAHADSTNAQAAVLPEEMQRLAPGIRAFVRGAFGPSTYGENLRLRGLFFSSGRQEGVMRSRLLDELETFKESRWALPNTNNSLFLNDFFTTILPRERGLGQLADRLFSGLSLRRHAGLVSCLLFLLTLCAYFSVSFMDNLDTLRQARRDIPQAPALPADLSGRVKVLSGVVNDIQEFEEHRNKYAWMLPGSAQTDMALNALKRCYVHWMRPGLLSLDTEVISATLAELPPERRRMQLPLHQMLRMG